MHGRIQLASKAASIPTLLQQATVATLELT